MRHLPFEDLGFAKVDHHRALRHGIPEVVFGLGKTADHVIAIAGSLLDRGGNVLITRTHPEMAERVLKELAWRRIFSPVRRDSLLASTDGPRKGKIAVVCAGTSDIPVAEEAQVTAEVMGNEVESIHDVGVAGIHRLISNSDKAGIGSPRHCVCAGMEGALPSAVGGMVSVPVIAVPTSVGYGASFSGLAALLGMLNSCASNVTVVNIDNGFGAGYVASIVNHL